MNLFSWMLLTAVFPLAFSFTGFAPSSRRTHRQLKGTVERSPSQFHRADPAPRSPGHLAYLKKHNNGDGALVGGSDGGDGGKHPPSCLRREFLGTWGGAIGTVFCFLSRPSPASAVSNPLNLKGSYWETGQLYEKKRDELSLDPDDLIVSLNGMASSLDSLVEVAEEGRMDELSRLLRGGAVSESRLRLAGNALIDSITDDDREYQASELFRVFLLKFDLLDRSVSSAARRSKADGGAVSTLALGAVAPLGAINRISSDSSLGGIGGGDSRFEVIAALGEASKTLREFNSAARDAIRLQGQ